MFGYADQKLLYMHILNLKKHSLAILELVASSII